MYASNYDYFCHALVNAEIIFNEHYLTTVSGMQIGTGVSCKMGHPVMQNGTDRHAKWDGSCKMGHRVLRVQNGWPVCK